MRKQTGFTLIELILYLALVSIFISGTILFAWDVVYINEKTIQQQLVEQNSRTALARISYEIRRAEDINSISTNSIELENGINDTTISLSSGTVQITTNGMGPYSLTSNQVYVTDLIFTQPGSSNEDTKNINVSITVRQTQTESSQQFKAQTFMSTSVELNTQFNDARSLLINAEGYQLNDNLEQIYLQNLGNNNVTIDTITPTWTGGGNIKEIKISNNVVWQGEEPSGTILDITNVDIVAGASEILIDALEFTGDISGEVLNITFTTTDNSNAKVEINDN